MKPQKIYEIFTEALANENIKAELIEILSEKASENHIEGQIELFPQTDTTALVAENASLTRKIALLELEAGRLESENAALVNQLKRCKDMLNTYCSAFAMQIALYDKYKNLSEGSEKVMRGIFKNQTLSGIFICGVQLDNLRSLRDYTEKLVLDSYAEKKGDIAILSELYAYLLSCYNSTYTKPVYRLTETVAGDEFDDNIHRNIGTARSGKISAVLLQGCAAAGNGKIIRKAIVSL